MRYLKLLGLLAVFLGISLFGASNAQAQRVTFGIGIGAPGYYGPAPVCTYGYYDYYPYACAPYGYYGPDWFAGGVFIGAGPWFHGGYRHGYYGREYGYGRGAFYGRGGYAYSGRGSYGRGEYYTERRGGFSGGYRGGNFRGQAFRSDGSGGFHGGS